MGLRDQIMKALDSLGLYGMRATFDEIFAADTKSRGHSGEDPLRVAGG